ncbi:restriction endonuclease subunit S [Methylotenera mobilis]|uniref:Restriction modification system DNA specificity domain protein n=1 Tax=Methylotenera mobilis (strain JLW8 / ATCC BAA-1282 / DSM 17540) TaxID=583345 RepID=C6WSP6_METML|nr:restriction endonuclease subunit S [Methylotenera mobilis]ACT47138.1 restriction modification system DNA specificity domain protein [Methylotenera mobilis JLW8]
MSEWKTVKLEEIASVIDSLHQTPSYSDLGLPMVRVTDIKKGKLNLTNTLKVSKEVFDKFSKNHTPKKGDILFSRVGSYGNTCIVDDETEFCLGQNTAFIVPNENSLFLYYFLNSPNGINEIESSVAGSTQPTVSLKSIKNFEIPQPPHREQKAIASVLSSLDDKIDLLHRQNNTLEYMTETLFRQWFVEEALEDWAFVELGEYVNCFNGVSYKSAELNPSKTAMVTLKSFDRNGGFRLDGFKEFTGRYKEQHVVVQGDLVVAHTDITQNAEVIGNPVLVVASPDYETIVISMDLVKVTSKFDWLSNEFLYRMMRTREFKEHCLGYSNGSTVLHLSKQAIPTYEFFLPPKEKIQSFTTIAKDMLGKKFKNIEQIQILEKLRDTLLPKLMSGEIRINNG